MFGLFLQDWIWFFSKPFHWLLPSFTSLATANGFFFLSSVPNIWACFHNSVISPLLILS